MCSKLLNDLNQLSQSRVVQNSVVSEDMKPTQTEPVSSAGANKGVYFIGGLAVLLIVFSALSMSISLKISTQFEKAGSDAAAVMEALNKQKNEIQHVQSLVKEKNAEILAQVSDLNVRLDILEKAVKQGDAHISEISAAQGALKSLLESSIRDFNVSDQLILEKHIQLNNKVQKMIDKNPLFLNLE